MHIVHVVRQFAPGIGGIENYVANLARQQVANGHQVTVVTLDRIFAQPDRRLPEREWQAGCRIIRVPYRGSPRYPLAPTFLRHLAGADIVHVHAVDFFCDAAAWARPLHGRPMVLSTHGGFFHTGYARRLKQVFFHTVTRLSLRAYRTVIASSQSDHDTFAKVRRGGLALVENGVDVGKFAQAGPEAFGRHIVFIGRFASNKRIERLVHLVAALCRRDPQWRLTIAGIDWDQTGDELRQLAAALGVADRVDVHVSIDDLALRALLSKASIIASASSYEGFGISIVEGMSAGLWPLLSDIPAFRRLRALSELGEIVDFDDPEATADRLIAVAPDLARNWTALRGSAIAFAARYDWHAVAGEIERLYRRALQDGDRNILGIGVAALRRDEAVAAIDRRAAAGHPTAIAFLNSHGANIAQGRADFRAALDRMLVLNDGAGLDIASRLLYGAPFPANLNGTDFVPHYLASTGQAHGIFLLGARTEVVAAAAARLARDYPRHRIVGFRDGYFAAEDEPAVIDAIRASGADLLLVAMGNPLQELWVDRHLDETGVRLAFSVGALFDFLASAVPRAPEWLRSLRAEWVFRLTIEPRRMWRRYLIGNAVFLARAMRQRIAGTRPRLATEGDSDNQAVGSKGGSRVRAT